MGTLDIIIVAYFASRVVMKKHKKYRAFILFMRIISDAFDLNVLKIIAKLYM